MVNELKTFEVSQSTEPKHHKSYIDAFTVAEAMDIFVKKNNDQSQKKITIDDIAYCTPTTKKPYRELIKNPMQGSKTNYKVDVSLKDVPASLNRYREAYKLKTQPSFQRPLVWTGKQQIQFIEYLLRGGLSGRQIYFNFPDWQGNTEDFENQEMVVVDGQQRLNAIINFLDNNFPVFDEVFARDFQYFPSDARLEFHVNGLKSDKDILQWYLDLNDTGKPHTDEELDKVRKLLEKAC